MAATAELASCLHTTVGDQMQKFNFLAPRRSIKLSPLRPPWTYTKQAENHLKKIENIVDGQGSLALHMNEPLDASKSEEVLRKLFHNQPPRVVENRNSSSKDYVSMTWTHVLSGATVDQFELQENGLYCRCIDGIVVEVPEYVRDMLPTLQGLIRPHPTTEDMRRELEATSRISESMGELMEWLAKLLGNAKAINTKLERHADAIRNYLASNQHPSTPTVDQEKTDLEERMDIDRENSICENPGGDIPYRAPQADSLQGIASEKIVDGQIQFDGSGHPQATSNIMRILQETASRDTDTDVDMLDDSSDSIPPSYVRSTITPNTDIMPDDRVTRSPRKYPKPKDALRQSQDEILTGIPWSKSDSRIPPSDNERANGYYFIETLRLRGTKWADIVVPYALKFNVRRSALSLQQYMYRWRNTAKLVILKYRRGRNPQLTSSNKPLQMRLPSVQGHATPIFPQATTARRLTYHHEIPEDV